MTTSKNKKKQLEWTRRALKDRLAIWDYIALHELSPLNATLVDARIVQLLDRLSSLPLSGKPYKKGLRLAIVPKTKFTVVYLVDSDAIKIIRISHQRKKVV